MATNVYSIKDTTLVSIADAIRAKDGTTDKIKVSDIPARITSLGERVVKSRLYHITSIADIPDVFWERVKAVGSDGKISGVDDFFLIWSDNSYEPVNTNFQNPGGVSPYWRYTSYRPFPYEAQDGTNVGISFTYETKTLRRYYTGMFTTISDSDIKEIIILMSEDYGVDRGGGIYI